MTTVTQGTFGRRFYDDGRTVVLKDTRTEIDVKPVLEKRLVPHGTRGFYRRRNAGELIVNPYFVSTVHRALPQPQFYKRSECVRPLPWKTYRDLWEFWEPMTEQTCLAHGISPDGGVLRPDPSFSKEALITKAIARANEGTWDASTSLAELGETAATIAFLIKGVTSPMKSLTKMFCREAGKKGFKSFNKLSLKQVFSSTSSGWLLWRYGIRPTISDIESAIDAYNKAAKLKYRHSVRPNGSDTLVGQRPLLVKTAPEPKITVFRECGFVQQQYSHKGQCVVTTDYEYESAKAYWIDQLGFTARAIPSVAYEVLPFSFILDWFVNISQWIQTLSPPTGATNRVMSYSDKLFDRSDWKLQPFEWTEKSASGEVWKLSLKGASFTEDVQQFERTVENPGHIQTPNYGSGFNTLRSLDLAAIFLQLSRLLRK